MSKLTPANPQKVFINLEHGNERYVAAATPPVKLREVLDRDSAFVYNSWLKSYRSMVRSCPSEIYYQEHHQVIQRAVERSEVIVAVNPGDEDQIYGYIVAERGLSGPGKELTIHWTYVKEAFRKLGVATHLLKFFDLRPDATVFYTHFTLCAKDIANKKRFIYNPYRMGIGGVI